MRYRDDRNPGKRKRRFQWRGPKLELVDEQEEDYSGPIYDDGMLDEVTVVGDRFSEDNLTPGNIATLGLLNAAKRRLTRNVYPFGYGAGDTERSEKLADALLFPNKVKEWSGQTEFQDKIDQLASLRSGKPYVDEQGYFNSALPLAERQQLLQYMMGQDASQFHGIPLSGEVFGKKIGIRTSQYRPETESDPNTHYFSSPLTEETIKSDIKQITEQLIKEGKDPSGILNPGSGYSVIQPGVGQAAENPLYGVVLGNMTVTKGEDEKGKYISYYDIWDLQPYNYDPLDETNWIKTMHELPEYVIPENVPFFGGDTIGGMEVKENTMYNIAENLQEFGNVKPAELYGRIYYEENPDGTIEFIDENKSKSKKKKYRNGGLVGETVEDRTKKYRKGGPVGEPVILDEVEVVAPKFKPKGWSKGIRKRFAENINPFSYQKVMPRVLGALFGRKEEKDYYRFDDEAARERYALLDISMGQPVRDEAIGSLKVSEYQPSQSSDSSAVYFRSPYTERDIKRRMVHKRNLQPNPSKEVVPVLPDDEPYLGSGQLENRMYSGVLGNYTIGTGEDEKGKYISYYDKWDLRQVAPMAQDAIGVIAPEIYGRLYYKENPDGSITYLD